MRVCLFPSPCPLPKGEGECALRGLPDSSSTRLAPNHLPLFRHALRSQIATLKTGRGEHRKYLPRVFTEHGALMAASVLNSPKAVEMSILVVRAFVRLRQFLATHRQVSAKLDELERTVAAHDKHIVTLFDAVRSLMAMPEKPKRRIGFRS